MSQEISQVRERINALVSDIHDIIDTMIDIAVDFVDMQGVPVDEMKERTKKTYDPLFSKLERETLELMELLRPYGIDNNDVEIIKMAINELKDLSIRTYDAYIYDDFKVGLRFFESIISLINGETPRFSDGALDQAFSDQLIWNLMRLGYKFITIYETMEKQGKVSK